MKQRKSTFSVADIALTGVMAATLEAVKLALSALPNIELVSLLLALYSYVFGISGVLAAFIFVAAEILVWGLNTWVISYLIYWPLLALLFWMISKRVSNRFAITGIAALMTFLFGVLTSLVDVGLFSGYWDRFFERFMIYYLRGIWFYVVHIVCNVVVFITLFKPLEALFERLKKQFDKNVKR